MRHAPAVRSFALCDGNHEPYVRLMYLRKLGIIADDSEFTPEVDAKFDLRIAGVNHCTWILECRYDGRDLLPLLLEKTREAARHEYDRAPSPKAKPRLNANYELALMELYGAFPTAASHTKEYVPFFQGYGVTPVTPEPIICFDGYNRADEMAEAWAETEKLATGETPISRLFETGRGDHATDIIESMWGGLGKKFYINSANRGAVANLPDDAFLELRCELDMQGPRPLPAGASAQAAALHGLAYDDRQVTGFFGTDRRASFDAQWTRPSGAGDVRMYMLYDAFCGGDAWVLTSYGNYTRQSKPVYPFDGSMLRWGMGDRGACTRYMGYIQKFW